MVEIAALSEPMKANGREPVAIARTAPIVPPWATHTHAPTSVPLGDPPDRRAHASGDRGVGLGAGNQVPAFFFEDPGCQRIALGDALTVATAFPLSEANLGQRRFDLRRQAESLSERSRRLDGASQGGDVDRVDAGCPETVGDERRLQSTCTRELRVAPAVDEGEGLIGIGGLGLPVTHQKQLGRPNR